MTSDSKQSPTVQIALRLTPYLRDRIKAAAQSNNRSVNSELIATLEERYPAPLDNEAIAKDLLSILNEIYHGKSLEERLAVYKELEKSPLNAELSEPERFLRIMKRLAEIPRNSDGSLDLSEVNT